MTGHTSAPPVRSGKLFAIDNTRRREGQMDERYDSYCAVDPLFYDSLTNTRAEVATYLAERELPAGWEQAVKDDWLICSPVDDPLPPQGWKIHVSAGLDNAERVLTAVWDYCVPRDLGFKFLRGP